MGVLFEVILPLLMVGLAAWICLRVVPPHLKIKG